MKKINFVHFRSIIPVILIVVSGCGCSRERTHSPVGGTGALVDISGNKYHTVLIGSQVWMQENLKVTKFRNGDPIPEITGDIEWGNFKTGAFCYFQNDKKSGRTYGKLYNWFAVSDNRGLCPSGWHVPDDEEWQLLADFLGGDKAAGDKMKETGYKHWAKPNESATNLSGFTALPAGGRDEYGKFIIDKYGGHWWSTTEDGPTDIWVRSIYFGYGSILRDSYNKNSGFSVRCLKDGPKT